MLRAIGLGQVLDDHGCAINQIRVTDGLSPLHLHFDARTEGAAADPLGYMLENRLLRVALMAAAKPAKNVSVFAPARVADIRREATGATVTGMASSPRVRVASPGGLEQDASAAARHTKIR